MFVCIYAGFAFGQNPVNVTMSVAPTTVPAGGRGTARITASIDAPWKMYSITQGAGGPIPTRITGGDGPFKVGPPSGPRPKVAMDPTFQINTETYTGSPGFSVPFTVNADAPEGPQTLNVNFRYQVCNDTVCLPPKTVKLTASVTVTAAKATASPTGSSTPTPTGTPTAAPTGSPSASPTPTEDANPNVPGVTIFESNSNTHSNSGAVVRPVESDIKNPPIWGFIWLAITFGALSLLTPCVFPMIPITVSYFTKHGSDTRLGSIRDAGIYALGIILTFTLLGILLALLFGAAGINRFAANPYINLLITGIFLAFAFSLLGAYNLGVPASVLTKLDGFTRSKESGKVIGLLL
ncbi:MAG: protein-disulfide reductase DsbD domain-containing protein, partial [Pyrinomonadaceae bacterium]